MQQEVNTHVTRRSNLFHVISEVPPNYATGGYSYSYSYLDAIFKTRQHYLTEMDCWVKTAMSESGVAFANFILRVQNETLSKGRSCERAESAIC